MKEKFEELLDSLFDAGFFLEETVEMVELAMINKALAAHGGNRTKASAALGIHRNTLQRKIEFYQLRPKRSKKVPARAGARSAGKRQSA